MTGNTGRTLPPSRKGMTHSNSAREKIARAQRGEKNSYAKLTEEDVRDIYRRANNGLETQRNIAADYNVSISTVSGIKRKSSWAHIHESGV